MVATGVLSRVAGVDTHLSSLSGLVVHLLVSMFVGMSYGMLFRNEASNLGMGIAWGWLFGLVWWYAGPLTLLPLAAVASGASNLWCFDCARVLPAGASLYEPPHA